MPLDCPPPAPNWGLVAFFVSGDQIPARGVSYRAHSPQREPAQPTAVNSSEQFCPPNPKELDSAERTVAVRAVLGT